MNVYKILLLTVISLCFIQTCMAYSHEIITNYAGTGSGTKVIRFDDPDEMNFRLFLLNNSECHDNNANLTYKNYTNVFLPICHFYYNGSEGNGFTWDNIAFFWDTNADSINVSDMPLFMMENGTNNSFYKSVQGVMLDFTGSGSISIFGPPREYNFSHNTDSVYGVGANNYMNQDINNITSLTLEANSQFSLVTNFTHAVDRDAEGYIGNHIFNGNFYYTSWFGVSPAIHVYTQPSGWKMAWSTIVSDVSIVRFKEDATYSMAESIFTNHLQDTKEGGNGMCFISARGIIVNNSMQGKLSCPKIGFAFAAQFVMNFLDSEKITGTWEVKSFWGSADVLIQFTLDYFFKDKYDNSINATYTIVDNTGKTYTNSTEHMQQVVDVERHQGSPSGTYTYTTYRPMAFTVQSNNESFVNIINHSISPTYKNIGFLPFTMYSDLEIHSLYWDANSDTGIDFGS